jgi:hypothetical protein
MGGLECVITGLMDEFKDFFQRWKISREIFTGFIVIVSFFVALCCVTPVSDVTELKSRPHLTNKNVLFFRVACIFLPSWKLMLQAFLFF